MIDQKISRIAETLRNINKNFSGIPLHKIRITNMFFTFYKSEYDGHLIEESIEIKHKKFLDIYVEDKIVKVNQKGLDYIRIADEFHTKVNKLYKEYNSMLNKL